MEAPSIFATSMILDIKPASSTKMPLFSSFVNICLVTVTPGP
ncbi:Uncharacterised protein [Yersinia aldovae]|uniref:Uncharacterized protein n=1 Tax=Yersinia aldovae TaxID=29483 RepID=A0A0T9TFZ7_YERAL|nr:hypothetical protein AT01_3850 [Yersinia aldovae 670-83]CNJ21827.1 Uncharacterised protein [Yersinia aldovae]CNK78905.1 Uncharacterised protein [Yersinia aldovae]CNK87870.1 Uncharacterised protein [Yersinia aldovae]